MNVTDRTLGARKKDQKIPSRAKTRAVWSCTKNVIFIVLIEHNIISIYVAEHLPKQKTSQKQYMKIVIIKPELVIFRIWNVALYTARLLRAQAELEVEWGTVGKGLVCSLKICNQLWSFASRKAITWQHNARNICHFAGNFVWVPCPWNVIPACKRP